MRPGVVDGGVSEPEPETEAEADAETEREAEVEGSAASGPGSDAADRDSTPGPDPVVRRGGDVSYESVGAAEGLSKGVLLDASDGAPNFALRRFTLAPGARVPAHTNAVEHEQYVLEGEYVVGIGDEERVVRAGDSLFIPAGVVHWYRNEGEEAGAFLCAVPNGDDAIELVDDSGA
jgi:quercetin dioxygenase-like cupin family protein